MPATSAAALNGHHAAPTHVPAATPPLLPQNIGTANTQLVDRNWDTLHKGTYIVKNIREAISKSLVGQTQVCDVLTIGGVTRRGALIVGPKGLAKSHATKVAAVVVGLENMYVRFQGVPDLTATQMTGGRLPFAGEDGAVQFWIGRLLTGVWFHIDELNRLPERVQAVLLSAMEEGEIYIEGKPHPVQPGFTLFATLNEAEKGTYSIADALNDRFGYSARAVWLDSASNKRILKRDFVTQPEAVCGQSGLDMAQEAANMIVAELLNREDDKIYLVLDTLVKLLQSDNSGFRVPKSVSNDKEPTIGIRAMEAALKAAAIYVMMEENDHPQFTIQIRHLIDAVIVAFQHRLQLTVESREAKYTVESLLRYQLDVARKMVGI